MRQLPVGAPEWFNFRFLKSIRISVIRTAFTYPLFFFYRNRLHPLHLSLHLIMHIRSSFNPTLAMFDCLRSTDSHLVQVNALPLVIFNLVKLFKLISFVVKLNFILQLLLLLIIILFLLVHCRSQLVQLFWDKNKHRQYMSQQTKRSLTYQWAQILCPCCTSWCQIGLFWCRGWLALSPSPPPPKIVSFQQCLSKATTWRV